MNKKQFSAKTSSGRRVAGPDGRGPTLEWYRSNFLDAFMPPVILSSIGIAFITIRLRGFEWMDTWWLWALTLWPLLMYFGFKSDTLAAGADWVQRKTVWVDTYNLTKVKITRVPNKLILDLTDSDGREVSIDLPDIQQNHALWDLVYNGIRHSVADGQVITNAAAQYNLNLPHPTA